MARSSDPIRLTADPNAAPELRSLLTEARRSVPGPAELGRLNSRIEAAIAAGLPGPEIGTLPPPGSSGLLGLKVLGVASGLVAGAVLVGTLWRPVEPPPLASVSGRSVSIEPAPPATRISLSASAAPTEESAAAAAPRPSVRSVAREPAGPRLGEAALLDRARAALGEDPARALELAREHQQRYPQGALAQEREVITVEALRRLGQREQAEVRGREFQRQYPGSVHRRKIEESTRGD